MRFENLSSEVECRCCLECMGIIPAHCTHCPQYGERIAAAIEDGHDYSHLIGDPGIQAAKVFDAARFDGLLTDYDCILLKFGMHILWQ